MATSYKFTFTGQTPILIHADNIELSDELEAWRKDPANKNFSKPGDDRSPPWSWMCALWSDGEHLTIPSDNIMVALRSAGAKMTMKGQESFKSVTQSGLVILEEHCQLIGPKGTVAMAKIRELHDLPFKEQTDRVRDLGFSLFVKRVAVGQSKHVRVRARFDAWSVIGTIEILDPIISPEVLAKLMDIAGDKMGLGNWRPSAKKSPGPYGRFAAKLVAVAAKKSA